MLQRFMLIGVGGSGGQVLRRTWNETLLRLKATPGGWSNGMPRCWQFLHIDIPENPDGLDDPSVPSALLDSSRYLGLAKAPKDSKFYFDGLTQPAQRLQWTADWRPDPNVVPEPWKGGGQRRLAGNMISLLELERIREKLKSAAQQLQTDEAKMDLQRVSQALGDASNTLQDAQPRVILISSLSGGAGSGTFLNVAELLRTCAVDGLDWMRNSIGIYLAPNVFQFSGAKAGLEPNALAAISELISAYVAEGPHDGDDANMLHLGAGAAPLTGRRAPEWNFLVGRSNGEVTFDNERDVYGALARCLTTIFTDAAVLDQFESKVLNNWDGQPTALPIVDLHAGSAQQRNPFSALGYASVGLGRSRFAQYGAERLARGAVKQLLEGHLRYQDPDRPLAGEALIASVANQHTARFFEASGVWEEDVDGQVHDQVLDALRNQAEIRTRLDGIKVTLGAGMPEKDLKRQMDPAQWKQSMVQRIEEKQWEFTKDAERQRLLNARRWVDEIQTRLLDETARSIGVVGIPVTIELLHRLGAQLERAASGLERERHDRLDPAFKAAIASVKSCFNGLGEKLITGRHPAVADAANHGTMGMGKSAEMDTYALAAGLMRDLRSGFIAPLEQALSTAVSDLTHMRDGHERAAALIRSWSANSVPERLQPAKNELLLDHPDDYPDLLNGLLVGTFRAGDDPASSLGHEGAEARAVSEIVSGMWPRTAVVREVPHQQLIAIDQYWQTELPNVNPGSPPQRAKFSVSLEPDGIFEQAESWVRERPGALHEFVRMSLAEELEKANSARRSDFVKSVSRMLALGRPLATVSEEALRAVHGEHAQVEFTRIITPIPVGPESPIRKDLESVLMNIGQVDPARVGECFDPAMSGDSIGVVSFITGSMQPFVFSSLTSSIREEWNQCATNVAAQRSFWRYRRTRTLPGFVPVSPSVMRAMARGFITGRILGYLPDPEPARPFAIWHDREWLDFPTHLLGGTPAHAGDALPALLESLILAWLYAGSGNHDSTKAYRAMLELGSGGEDHDGAGTLAQYQYLNPALKRWVETGEVTTGAPTPVEQVLAGSAEERRDALRRVLEQIRDRYVALEPPRVAKDGMLHADRSWGIREVVLDAVADLLDALEAVSPGASGKIV